MLLAGETNNGLLPVINKWSTLMNMLDFNP
jgi:hypothetical protein